MNIAPRLLEDLVVCRCNPLSNLGLFESIDRIAGYDATIWLGLMAPAGTPKPIIDKLNAAVNAAVKRPDIVKLWTAQGAVPMSMTPEEFDKYLRGDIVKWAEVVRRFGDKPQ